MYTFSTITTNVVSGKWFNLVGWKFIGFIQLYIDGYMKNQQWIEKNNESTNNNDVKKELFLNVLNVQIILFE